MTPATHDAAPELDVVRMERDVQALAGIGRVGSDPTDAGDAGDVGASTGGLCRLAWTDDEFAAKAYVEGELRQVGFQTSYDEAGNLWGEWGPKDAPEGALAFGSHLDTVPNGGAYDGALGVVAALESCRGLALSGNKAVRPVRMVVFTDEEGARFGTGLFGSTAVAGSADLPHLETVRDAQGISLAAAMQARDRNLADLPGAAVRASGLAAYLELHIEQGPRLERMGQDIAVVDVITGITQLRFVFMGEANHAGTTAIADRHDASLPAASCALALRRAAAASGGRAVATAGLWEVRPGAANVIPGHTSLSVEVRSPDPVVLQDILDVTERAAREAAQREGVVVSTEVRHRVPAARMDALWRQRLRWAAVARGAPDPPDFVSWAGHDAGALARVLPVAMLFVPSRAGVSHAPGEYTAPESYRPGAQAFYDTIWRWAQGESFEPSRDAVPFQGQGFGDPSPSGTFR